TKIVKLQLGQLKKMLDKQHITIDATDEAVTLLANKGYDPQYGARPIKRVIQRDVLNKLSKELLSGQIKADSIVLIDAFDDELVFRNQSELVE
ncbi:MAG: type VI secretion system ATPase TssH, partial [Flavobacteriaceae bacterium]